MQSEIDFDSQDVELERVSLNIGDLVLGFVNRLPDGAQFQGWELEEHITKHRRITPGSATRILRDLRKQGMIDVSCIDRSTSTYEVNHDHTH